MNKNEITCMYALDKIKCNFMYTMYMCEKRDVNFPLISVILCVYVVGVFNLLNEILYFDVAICDTHNYGNIFQSCLENQVFL